MMAMTWNALSHSYISSRSAHAREHLLHMRDRRLRQDAVAEIEDERPIRKRSKNLVDGPVERAAARHQRQGIEISLHRHADLDLIARECKIGRPIKTHGIDRDLFH